MPKLTTDYPITIVFRARESEAVVKLCWRSAEGLAKQRLWDHTPTNLMIRCGRITYVRRLSLFNRFDR